MNKFCVFAKNKETYFIKRLIEEVGQGVVLFDPWSDLELPEAHHYITRTTGVYQSDLDLMMMKTLSAEKLINPLKVLTRFRTKSSQYQWFEENDFPALPWLMVKGTDLLMIEKFFRLYPEMVVKPLAGQGGWGIEVLRWEQFKSWKKKKSGDEDYLLQPFIKGAIEYRSFFIRGEESIVLQRKVKSGITANFKKEGEAALSFLPPEFKHIVDKVIFKSEAHYGAIDLLVHDSQLSILELNSVPGIEQLEKISGRNIIKKLIDPIGNFL